MDLFLLSVIKRILNNKVTKLIPSPNIYRQHLKPNKIVSF